MFKSDFRHEKSGFKLKKCTWGAMDHGYLIGFQFTPGQVFSMQRPE